MEEREAKLGAKRRGRRGYFPFLGGGDGCGRWPTVLPGFAFAYLVVTNLPVKALWNGPVDEFLAMVYTSFI